MAQEVQRILIKYEADIKELRKDLDGVKKEMRGVEREVQTRGKAITNTFKAVGTAALAAFSVREVIQLGKELNNLQREAQGVKRSFDAVFDQGALSRLRTATAGTVSDLELMKVALRGREFGIPEATLARGLEFARVQANKLGEDIGFLTNSIVDGLGRKSPLILDNLGISQAELSQKVKETGDFYEGVAAVIEGKLGEAGASGTIETLADRQARVNAQLENLRVRLSEQLVPFFDALTTAALNSLDAIEQVSRFGITVGNEATQRAREEAEAIFKAQRESLVAQIEAGKLSNEAARALIEGSIQSLEENFQRVQDGIDNTGEKARRFLGLITGAGGIGIAQALGQAGLGEGAREGAEELVKLDAEIEVLRASLGLFQDEIESTTSAQDKNTAATKKGVVQLTEFAQAYRDAIDNAIAFRRELGKLTDGELFSPSQIAGEELDTLFLKYRASVENGLDEIGQTTEQFNEDQEDINVLGMSPEQFNNQLAQQQAIYEEFSEEIKFQNQSIALSANRAFVGLLEGVAEATGDSGELAKAFLVFNKLIAIAEIVINLQKEIAGISANPTLTLLPDLGVAAKTTAIAAAKTRAGISIATILATTIPDLAFAEGTSDAPGGAAWVGERGPEIMHVPKGARVFTAEASKNERGLIDAINDGTVNRYLQDTYITPALTGFAKNIAQSAAWQGYDDFALRQAIKGNRVVGLDKRTIRALTNSTRLRHR